MAVQKSSSNIESDMMETDNGGAAAAASGGAEPRDDQVIFKYTAKLQYVTVYLVMYG